MVAEMSDWSTCFDLGLEFQYTSGKETSQCLICNLECEVSDRHWRPNFHILAASCGAGHRLTTEMRSIVCSKCSIDLVLRITKREQTCFVQDCKRAWVVDLNKVKPRVSEQLFSRSVFLILFELFGSSMLSLQDMPIL
jgi:hypothetical protein